ncbi:DNA-binding transcriptional regulator GbsR (MarR family) [Lipingzhangella halophila]|uniref:DNA-binding transcriptional regulator GbsR (MarR family) n=1 Tax=Lipingzhangella halophila TaxID=1783352 RepID=A0A7W7RM81_9ACTN|nr:MarR family transcriptional regulator [Lipingzhangella halophila]MBB4934564.1 DNA-binding transcriptional regulator GbsR (MarR family) [Lipingzhangella halophila]
MSLSEDRRKTTEQFALVLTEHGMQRMASRVMATFIFTEKPTLTQGEVAEELDVSPGSVSGAIRILMSVGLVERVPAAGSRRDHHRLRDDAWTTMFTRQNHALEGMMSLAQEGIETTEPGSNARQRLELMRDFYAYLLDELPAVIERWKQQRAERQASETR